MWALKQWVELNANKFDDAQEKIMRCAQRTYAMNPARKDAAAFVGKEALDIAGLTSGEKVIVPRKPVMVEAEGGSVTFNIDNDMWTPVTSADESVKAKFTGRVESAFEITVKFIEWGANLEELNQKYVDSIKDAKGYVQLENETITLSGTQYYRVLYDSEEADAVIRREALLIRTKGDAPGMALIIQATREAFPELASELGKIRSSLKYTE
jgi:hypothetical protein